MIVPGVIMVMTLVSFDGAASVGVVPYKSYKECHASLKHPVDKSRYAYADRVCMNDPSTVNSLATAEGKTPRAGGPKSGWKD